MTKDRNAHPKAMSKKSLIKHSLIAPFFPQTLFWNCPSYIYPAGIQRNCTENRLLAIPLTSPISRIETKHIYPAMKALSVGLVYLFAGSLGDGTGPELLISLIKFSAALTTGEPWISSRRMLMKKEDKLEVSVSWYSTLN